MRGLFVLCSRLCQELKIEAIMSIVEGLRPSSALQAMFYVYHGVFYRFFAELYMDLFNSAFVKIILI